MNSDLAGTPFVWITASVQRSMETISLRFCWGSPGWFGSSLQFSYWLTGDTVIISAGIGFYCWIERFRVLLENATSISISRMPAKQSMRDLKKSRFNEVLTLDFIKHSAQLMWLPKAMLTGKTSFLAQIGWFRCLWFRSGLLKGAWPL